MATCIHGNGWSGIGQNPCPMCQQHGTVSAVRPLLTSFVVDTTAAPSAGCPNCDVLAARVAELEASESASERVYLEAASILRVELEGGATLGLLDGCRRVRAHIDHLSADVAELRELLIESVPTDLVVHAEAKCPSCGDGLTARLGTELKLSLHAERAAHALTRARLEAAERVVEACRDLRLARDERHARSGAMQEAAALARRGGPRGPDAIAAVERKHPIVHDVSDAVARIVDALDALPAAPARAGDDS